MKRLIPVLILLAAASAAGSYLDPRWKKPLAPTNQVVLSGNIEAHESLVGFRVQGRIVELPVEEGQQVAAGSLLARLEDAEDRQRVRLEEAGLHVRESNLALVLAGTRQQEIAAAEQSVNEAKIDLDQRQLDLARAERLLAKDEIAAQDRDQALTAVKRSNAVLEAATQRLSEAREGARKEDVSIAWANLNQANENLKLSHVNLDYTVLHAPSAGVVTVRQAEVGEVVSPGSPVVTIADLDHIWLRAYIAETDLARIHWGQQVAVTTDTYPGKKYIGRISFIASTAEFTPKSVQTYKERVTLVYRIKIDIDNPAHELKPGMPADALVELAPQAPAPAAATKAT